MKIDICSGNVLHGLMVNGYKHCGCCMVYNVLLQIQFCSIFTTTFCIDKKDDIQILPSITEMVASEVTEGLKKYNSHTKKLIIQINWAALDHFFFFFFVVMRTWKTLW